MTNDSVTQRQLQSDKADRASYYYYTGNCLFTLVTLVSNMLTFKLGDVSRKNLVDNIEFVCYSLVSIFNARSSYAIARSWGSVCPYVRPSVTRVLCDEMKEHTAEILTSHKRVINLVF